MSAADQKCVFLWAVPRSLSTVFTKCMSFVDGVQIWHEPYQYTYHKEKFAALATSTDPTEKFISQRIQEATQNVTLKVDEAEAPRGKLIDDSLFAYPWLKEQLEAEDEDKKLIFIKDMSYLVHGKYDYLPTERKYRHTFLIRNPHHVYKSLQKMLFGNIPEEMNVDDFNLRKFQLYDADRIFQYSYAFWKHVKENLDSDPIIIDATDLASNPGKILPKYFEAIGIPWREEYLTWNASSDTTNWKASYHAFTSAKLMGTHRRALESTEFIPGGAELPSRDDMTEDLIACIDEAMPFYSEMYEKRLKS